MSYAARSERGFTLLETILAASLGGMIILGVALWWRSGHGSFDRSLQRHQLQLEITTTVELLTSHLRRADGRTLEITSTPERPWSRLRFSAGGRRYEFSASGKNLLFTAGTLSPKVLSANLHTLQFAVDRNQLPTTLSWSLSVQRSGTAPITVKRSGLAHLPLEAP